MPLLPGWEWALSIRPVHTITPSRRPVNVSRGPSSPSCSNLISTHQRQGSSLLALFPSHQGYAALILSQQLSLFSCVFLLTAPSSTPLLQLATPHHSPGRQAPDPQDPQLPQPGCPPAPAVLCVPLEQESSKTHHCPREPDRTTSLILPAA